MPRRALREGAPALADDLLYGAAAIAEFVFGDEEERRKVYSLAEAKQLPVFYMGKIICSRRSSILNDIAARERAAATTQPAEFGADVETSRKALCRDSHGRASGPLDAIAELKGG